MREFTLTALSALQNNVSFPSQCHQKIQNMIRSCCSNILYAIVVFHFIDTVRQKLMSLPSEGCRYVRRFVCAGTATTGTFTPSYLLLHDLVRRRGTELSTWWRGSSPHWSSEAVNDHVVRRGGATTSSTLLLLSFTRRQPHRTITCS